MGLKEKSKGLILKVNNVSMLLEGDAFRYMIRIE